MSGAVALPLSEAELQFEAAGGTTVRRTVLPSGLRILTENVPGAQSAAIGFWVPIGSRDEQRSALGSTHFLEHLLFKGTPSRSALDIAIAFDEVGGEHNAVTAKEYTCYYAKVRDIHLPMATEVLADMVAGSVLDPAEFETEREVILEELAMAADDPADLVNERGFDAVFGDHPLGRPIGGDSGTIGAATRDAVDAYYRREYRPDRLIVTAAGGVDHDALVTTVSRALETAGWDLGAAVAPAARRSTAPADLGSGAAPIVVERPIEQAHLLIAAPTFGATDARRPTLAVLSAALGGGMSSRLFQEVREKRGLAYSVHSFAATFADAGLFGMYAASAPAKAPAVARLMHEQLRELADAGLDADELRRTVGQLSGGSALALEDSDTRMSRLGRSEITTGEFVDLDESLRRYDAVSLGDVQDLAAELAAAPWTLTAVGPLAADRFDGVFETSAAGA
ncbi:pitrilysin family protein [Herbiconiux sp. L3-i23]|uniref:M16 family metallopeptidase n=1 Tax=Herbiconiux sp. L3-i23 TaxID=2905871 RepID=UPI00206E2083|nr:pitrilysin family protein [Herbiconiux sp. L3-i23]BDI22195.1 peptidase M16 [Herbiconiux sp. L3-i23]